MDSPKPDFNIVERTWESRLRERGLTPSPKGAGIATGLDSLEIFRQETQVAEFEFDHSPGHGYLGSVEVKITFTHPSLGEFELRDLITQRGRSVSDALEGCANTFMDVTFPPLESLFTGRAPQGPGTGKVTLTSFTVELDRAIKWDVVLGQLHILNDQDGEARKRLKATPPLMLMQDTLTGHLSAPRLHWCKLYGSSSPTRGVIFGCAIDGQKSARGETEMAQRFGTPVPGDWEFRQFFAVRPIGDADPETTAKLRDHASKTFAPSKKSWWARIFRS